MADLPVDDLTADQLCFLWVLSQDKVPNLTSMSVALR